MRLTVTGQMNDSYTPIGEYAVIGNMHTALLIGPEGSIDWGCFPDFDSPAVFLRLLDRRKGGYCSIELNDLVSSSRRYLEKTNILETTFVTRNGRLRMTDFMPVRKRRQVELPDPEMPADHRLVRVFECVEGSVQFTIHVKPTFNFASESAEIRSDGDANKIFLGRTDALHVHCPHLQNQNDQVCAEIRLSAGEQTCAVLSYGRRGEQIGTLDRDEALTALRETTEYWTKLSENFRYQGEYQDEVLRSALILKLLTFEPTGAIVAAPTSSLPEAIGGGRNWDYRLSWLRDSQFVVTALMDLGYFDEAHDFFHFMKDACKGPMEDMRILYGIRGERLQQEEVLAHLEGYRGSKPVRVGNAAARQKQLDVYGELLDCMYSYSQTAASETERKSHAAEMWSMVEPMAEYVVRHWQELDNGIWESRGGLQHFVHSKAMCWVALERAARLARSMGADKHVDAWGTERDAIMQSLVTKGFDTELGAFVQSYGSRALDASTLRLSILGVIAPDDPRMLSTIKQIERRLMQHGLVYRYIEPLDDIPGEEAAFATCTFWLINNYILLGRLEEAREFFQHVLSYQSPLQLFAEEIDPVSGEQLGNFPQALTHVALINAAVRLSAALERR